MCRPTNGELRELLTTRFRGILGGRGRAGSGDDTDARDAVFEEVDNGGAEEDGQGDHLEVVCVPAVGSIK